ncbi:tRNA lysidine(34) synthetase TilS [Neptunomonas sp.]|uniref:tRNA lysidine(34) synthetase TilS n=1 Tax=Neptunomonas sp. TaxID=1971898 RepID=UPI0035614C3A
MSRQTLISAFLESIQAYPGKRWVIALSGGLDSIVMLHLAASHLPSCKLHVLHVNHHLQESADVWSAFCQKQAESLTLPFTQIDVFPANSSEAAARDARYAAFSHFLKAGDVLLLAHHADDQAETVLFRLLRGSGLHGLSGMPAGRMLGDNNIVRPLLSVPRLELETWARAQQLSWIEDPSNQRSLYDRNFLRLKVLPVLKERWPAVVERLSATSQLLRDERQMLDQYLDQELDGLLLGKLILNGDLLASFVPYKRKALIRRWVYNLQGDTLNEVQLAQLDQDFFHSAADKNPQFTLKSALLRRYRGNLYLCSLVKNEGPIQRLPLNEGRIGLEGGVLQVESCQAGIDRLRTLDKVVYAKRLDGMSCRPVGRGRKTLKKLFQEASVPPWQRQNWPVCMVDDEIVAIPGICICEGWNTTSSDAPGFSLSWEPF